jgi:hypothetical protein
VDSCRSVMYPMEQKCYIISYDDEQAQSFRRWRLERPCIVRMFAALRLTSPIVQSTASFEKASRGYSQYEGRRDQKTQGIPTDLYILCHEADHDEPGMRASDDYSNIVCSNCSGPTPHQYRREACYGCFLEWNANTAAYPWSIDS